MMNICKCSWSILLWVLYRHLLIVFETPPFCSLFYATLVLPTTAGWHDPTGFWNKRDTKNAKSLQALIYSNMNFPALSSFDQLASDKIFLAFLNLANFIRIIFVLDINPVTAWLSQWTTSDATFTCTSPDQQLNHQVVLSIPLTFQVHKALGWNSYILDRSFKSPTCIWHRICWGKTGQNISFLCQENNFPSEWGYA